jgi:hypothetical protein
MKQLVALLVVAAFASSLIGTWVFNQVTEQAGAAPSAAQISLSPTACPPDTIFELAGSGFPALASGSVSLGRTDLGAISTDENGIVRGFFMVPSEARPGPTKVRVTINGERESAAFTVLSTGEPSECSTTTP